MSETSNLELEQLAKKLGLNLVACICKDQLKQFPFQYGSYIINLANSTDIGSHWTAFYIERGNDGKPKACYFDSFAAPPPIAVDNYLKPCFPYLINNKQIQNINSGFCGIYCMYFIYFMQTQKNAIPNLDKRFTAFIRHFTDKPTRNLEILKDRFYHLN